MQATNRIIVNTIAQYARTIINMVLSLFSTRLVLKILGEGDYGVYVLVAGVVSLLSFITSSLVQSTQRYMSVNQGKNDMQNMKVVFSNSVLIHFVLATIVSALLICITPFLFNGYLNIDSTRIHAARVIYGQVVGIVCISFVSSPFSALLVSRENIVYTSLIGVIDGVLKVVLVLLMPLISIDKLILYGWVMFAIQIFNFVAIVTYPFIKYEECIMPRIRYFSKSYFVELLSFTWWNVYSGFAISLRNQGLAIVLNRLVSSVINAAYGLGMQISGMVSFVSTSLNNAIAPQLMASEGASDRDRMWLLAKTGSKLSFLLLSMIGIPTLFELPYLLDIWLVKVPEYAVLFGRTFLLMQIVDMLTIGLNTANKAIGRIGRYMFITVTPKLLLLPFGWLALAAGRPISIVCVLMVLVEIVCMLLRIPLLRNEAGFIWKDYIKDVFVLSLPPVLISAAVSYIIVLVCHSSFRFLLTGAISVLVFMLVCYKWSLTEVEKYKVNDVVVRILNAIYQHA